MDMPFTPPSHPDLTIENGTKTPDLAPIPRKFWKEPALLTQIRFTEPIK